MKIFSGQEGYQFIQLNEFMELEAKDNRL